MRSIITVCVLSLILVGVGARASAAEYHFVTIDVSYPGAFGPAVTGLNDHGTLVGG